MLFLRLKGAKESKGPKNIEVQVQAHVSEIACASQGPGAGRALGTGTPHAGKQRRERTGLAGPLRGGLITTSRFGHPQGSRKALWYCQLSGSNTKTY